MISVADERGWNQLRTRRDSQESSGGNGARQQGYPQDKNYTRRVEFNVPKSLQ